MYFSVVSSYFNRIDSTTSRLEMTELLAELLDQSSDQQAEIIINISMGMLRASYSPTVFNIAKKNLLLILDQFSKDDKLVEQLFNQYGDLGLVAYHLAEGNTHKELSLEYVYERLVLIESVSGQGSQEQKAHLILELIYSLDALSVKFVIRIIAGVLRLGFSDMTLLDALSWMYQKNKKIKPLLEEAYNKCANLGLIAKTLKSQGLEGIKNMSVEPGVPIRLAAAERLSDPQEIVDKLCDAIVQPKLDGMRVQAHVQSTSSGMKVTLFSRNLLDITDMFPEIVQSLCLYEGQNLIIEGEAIAYDPDTHKLLSFQHTAKRKRKYAIEDVAQELPVKFYAFDILYLNNTTVFEYPYSQRRILLESCIQCFTKTVIQCVDEQKVQSAQMLEDYFLAMINAGFEGVMVKKSDASYQAGKRNFNWIKLKRLEQSRMADTIDAVILGYYLGEGKRAAFGMGAFLAGVYNAAHDSFQTIAKVGTGLSDKEWQELYKHSQCIKVVEKPNNVDCAKELYPSVWLHPQIVCVLQADEITLSPLHTAYKTTYHQGLALRFPRFLEYTVDKTPEQTTSVNELKSMFDRQKSVN